MHTPHTPSTGEPDAIERAIQAKGLTAPRVTSIEIEDRIASEHYFTAADGVMNNDDLPLDYEFENGLYLLTFCVLVLKNGYMVTGESACASPENFDDVIGKRIARANAINKVWPLLGYELRTRLAEGRATTDDGTPA